MPAAGWGLTGLGVVDAFLNLVSFAAALLGRESPVGGQPRDLLVGARALPEPQPELGEYVTHDDDHLGKVVGADLADLGMSHASGISARTWRSVKGAGCSHASSSSTPSSGSWPPTPCTRMMSTRMSKRA
jgi:hypothetical protein